MPKDSVEPYLHGTPLPKVQEHDGGDKSAFKTGLKNAGMDDQPVKFCGQSDSSVRKMSDKLRSNELRGAEK